MVDLTWANAEKRVRFHRPQKDTSTLYLGLFGSPFKTLRMLVCFGIREPSIPAKRPRMTTLPVWNPPHRTYSGPNGVRPHGMPRWHHESSAATAGRRLIFGPPRCRPPYLLAGLWRLGHPHSQSESGLNENDNPSTQKELFGTNPASPRLARPLYPNKKVNNTSLSTATNDQDVSRKLIIDLEVQAK